MPRIEVRVQWWLQIYQTCPLTIRRRAHDLAPAYEEKWREMALDTFEPDTDNEEDGVCTLEISNMAELQAALRVFTVGIELGVTIKGAADVPVAEGWIGNYWPVGPDGTMELATFDRAQLDANLRGAAEKAVAGLRAALEGEKT
jgi:hypothetical protein